MLPGIEPDTPTPSLSRQGHPTIAHLVTGQPTVLAGDCDAAEEASNCAKGWSEALIPTGWHESSRGLSQHP